MAQVRDRLPDLLTHLERAALVDAARLVGDLTGSGVTVPALVDDLLVPAQVEVGLRWADARWTVAQEHAATSIVETVLTAAAVHAPAPAPGRASVVLVCAEGEWHALAGRMAAESLRSNGVDVVSLGPSLPSETLTGFLRERAPTALGVSCSLGSALPGALRCIAAAHEAGVPALAAGHAFGADGARARRLGADAWVARATDAVDVLTAWAADPPALTAARLPADDEWRRLAAEVLAGDLPDGDAASPLDTAVLRRLHQRRPDLDRALPALAPRLRSDVHYVLRHAAAAQLVGDAAVLHEYAGWLADVLAARRVPRDVVADLFAAGADVLADRYPVTAGLLTRTAGSLTAPSS